MSSDTKMCEGLLETLTHPTSLDEGDSRSLSQAGLCCVWRGRRPSYSASHGSTAKVTIDASPSVTQYSNVGDRSPSTDWFNYLEATALDLPK